MPGSLDPACDVGRQIVYLKREIHHGGKTATVDDDSLSAVQSSRLSRHRHRSHLGPRRAAPNAPSIATSPGDALTKPVLDGAGCGVLCPARCQDGWGVSGREARPLALLDGFDWFGCSDFYGCNFINASAEFSDPRHPVCKLVVARKRAPLNWVREAPQRYRRCRPPGPAPAAGRGRGDGPQLSAALALGTGQGTGGGRAGRGALVQFRGFDIQTPAHLLGLGQASSPFTAQSSSWASGAPAGPCTSSCMRNLPALRP